MPTETKKIAANMFRTGWRRSTHAVRRAPTPAPGRRPGTRPGRRRYPAHRRQIREEEGETDRGDQGGLVPPERDDGAHGPRDHAASRRQDQREEAEQAADGAESRRRRGRAPVAWVARKTSSRMATRSSITSMPRTRSSRRRGGRWSSKALATIMVEEIETTAPAKSRSTAASPAAGRPGSRGRTSARPRSRPPGPTIGSSRPSRRRLNSRPIENIRRMTPSSERVWMAAMSVTICGVMPARRGCRRRHSPTTTGSSESLADDGRDGGGREHGREVPEKDGRCDHRGGASSTAAPGFTRSAPRSRPG